MADNASELVVLGLRRMEYDEAAGLQERLRGECVASGGLRPRYLMRSSVASSAQWTSSNTTMVEVLQVVSSSKREENTRGRCASASSSLRRVPPSWDAISCNGPRGLGVKSASQDPHKVRERVSFPVNS